jgi:hypothetical protein
MEINEGSNGVAASTLEAKANEAISFIDALLGSVSQVEGTLSQAQTTDDPYIQLLQQTVYGGEEDKGQGGLLGVLQQSVYGDKEAQGGLLGVLQQAVKGDEGGKGGLLAELRQAVHGNEGEGGLLGELKKALGAANPPSGALGALANETSKGISAIHSYWSSLFKSPIDSSAGDKDRRGDER